jgi:hypothetical protein
MTDSTPRSTAPPAVTGKGAPPKIITTDQAERIIALLEAMTAQLARLAVLPAPAP